MPWSQRLKTNLKRVFFALGAAILGAIAPFVIAPFNENLRYAALPACYLLDLRNTFRHGFSFSNAVASLRESRRELTALRNERARLANKYSKASAERNSLISKAEMADEQCREVQPEFQDLEIETLQNEFVAIHETIAALRSRIGTDTTEAVNLLRFRALSVSQEVQRRKECEQSTRYFRMASLQQHQLDKIAEKSRAFNSHAYDREDELSRVIELTSARVDAFIPEMCVNLEL